MLSSKFISSECTGHSACGDYAFYLAIYDLFVDGKFLGRVECPSKHVLSYDEPYDEGQTLHFYPAEGVEMKIGEDLLSSSDDIGETSCVKINGVVYPFKRLFWEEKSDETLRCNEEELAWFEGDELISFSY
jgi:hypothetical protein